MVFNDVKRLLVDSGYDFVNSTVNSQIRKIPFFATLLSKDLFWEVAKFCNGLDNMIEFFR